MFRETSLHGIPEDWPETKKDRKQENRKRNARAHHQRDVKTVCNLSMYKVKDICAKHKDSGVSAVLPTKRKKK